VVLLAAAEAGLDIHEFTPLEVKLAVTGQGRAAKEQVGYMVKTLLGLDAVPQPDDVADALAVALTCAHTMATRRRWGDAFK
ncbi:MAG: crossover junction endodeoxyribonuclease RuvC, partial [Bacillota bacterium]